MRITWVQPAKEALLLCIEYDVAPDGGIELVALINAVDEDGDDPDGEAWLAWRRRTFDDEGFGCAAVGDDDLALLESTEDAVSLRAIVERIVLADRGTKERVT
jgi:hypothetical protein